MVHDGKVIAERYAAGVGVDTPLIGFSMTKSVVNALLGIMTQQGLTSPSLPAPVPEWRGSERSAPRDRDRASDAHDHGSRARRNQFRLRSFEPDVSLRRHGGLCRQRAADRTARQALGLFQRDHADSGADHSRRRRRPRADAGLCVARTVQSAGHATVTLEFDASGTLQGSANMLASARDWARFGLLYLNDGVVGGKRILHEDWVDFSAAATLDTDYGAGFWTNRSEHPNAKGRVRAGMPRDAFFASGTLGQRVVILPSQHMVVVRLGDCGRRGRRHPRAHAAGERGDRGGARLTSSFRGDAGASNPESDRFRVWCWRTIPE